MCILPLPALPDSPVDDSASANVDVVAKLRGNAGVHHGTGRDIERLTALELDPVRNVPFAGINPKHVRVVPVGQVLFRRVDK
ncbi:hypothetical protein SDC9_143367 [bioreactor metagenome]|uniref:Uncharacterized protein n=1 Tax=bioreactor metagenome TaxID=1076179 RepID=A0A645E3T6_9ZZZZ